MREKVKIVMTTVTLGLSGSFKDFQPDVLLIDEACQCLEPALLLSLRSDPKMVIMIGDHMQLPATVQSDNAAKTKFSRSLFERMREGNFFTDELMMTT